LSGLQSYGLENPLLGKFLMEYLVHILENRRIQVRIMARQDRNAVEVTRQSLDGVKVPGGERLCLGNDFLLLEASATGKENK
tara:strand:+ start:107 stop:352 length:246 start_codon:yes stop_codon:yes gene_type:complete